jgi:hypothetical protein
VAAGWPTVGGSGSLAGMQNTDTQKATVRGGSFTAPLAAARQGVLEVRRPRRLLTVRGGTMDALCRAAFDGGAPTARHEDGRVVIEYPRFSLARLLEPAPRTEVELNADLPWSLTIAGGLGESVLDLNALRLLALELRGGVGEVRIMLSRPAAAVPLRIAGGASKLAIVRPAGVAASLRVAGGASRLTFDGERYGAIGGETRLESADRESASGRYEIEVLGGASRLTVSTVEWSELEAPRASV